MGFIIYDKTLIIVYAKTRGVRHYALACPIGHAVSTCAEGNVVFSTDG